MRTVLDTIAGPPAPPPESSSSGDSSKENSSRDGGSSSSEHEGHLIHMIVVYAIKRWETLMFLHAMGAVRKYKRAVELRFD